MELGKQFAKATTKRSAYRQGKILAIYLEGNQLYN